MARDAHELELANACSEEWRRILRCLGGSQSLLWTQHVELSVFMCNNFENVTCHVTFSSEPLG